MVEVKGNGNIVSKEFQVSSFIRLHVAAKGVTELIQSDEEKVVVETDENLQNYFEIVNSGRTLFVSSESKFRKPAFTQCNIKVYIRQMDVLYVRCEGGDVIMKDPIRLTTPLEVKIQSQGNTSLNLDVPALKILSQCEGDVVLRGKSQLVEIKNQSEGDLWAKELSADELTLKNMSSGNVELFANNLIRIKHLGSGYVHYYGPAVLKDIKHFGEGVVQHKN